jgi:ribosomal protein L25 (general stress protein Ctc)
MISFRTKSIVHLTRKIYDSTLIRIAVKDEEESIIVFDADENCFYEGKGIGQGE